MSWGLREPGVAELLEATDLLVDGPFLVSRPDISRPWVGSTNQGFHFLTPRYSVDALIDVPDALEVRVSADGVVSINGWAESSDVDAVLAFDTQRVTDVNLIDPSPASAAQPGPDHAETLGALLGVEREKDEDQGPRDGEDRG